MMVSTTLLIGHQKVINRFSKFQALILPTCHFGQLPFLAQLSWWTTHNHKKIKPYLNQNFVQISFLLSDLTSKDSFRSVMTTIVVKSNKGILLDWDFKSI